MLCIYKNIFIIIMLITLNGCFSVGRRPNNIRRAEDNIYQKYPVMSEKELNKEKKYMQTGKGIFKEGPVVKSVDNNILKKKVNKNAVRNKRGVLQSGSNKNYINNTANSGFDSRDDFTGDTGSVQPMQPISSEGFGNGNVLFLKLKGSKKENKKLKEENKELKINIKKYKKKYDNNQSQFDKINKENKELKLKLMQAKEIMYKARLDEGLRPITYEVKKLDSLWKIAGQKQIYGNYYKWIELYHANKEKLDDPDRIYPGQVLIIPRYR